MASDEGFTVQDAFTDGGDTGEQVILRGYLAGRMVYDVRQPDGSYVRRVQGLPLGTHAVEGGVVPNAE